MVFFILFFDLQICQLKQIFANNAETEINKFVLRSLKTFN